MFIRKILYNVDDCQEFHHGMFLKVTLLRKNLQASVDMSVSIELSEMFLAHNPLRCKMLPVT